ncbi:RNA polymerase sigma-K factor [Heliorestis convoluta]|uniref:RNA polymerase sigma-K factor n=1 Tax=Heliorestis convoluta TaxID=356322 RepID=A0A5Q2N6F6_9FIRM|nr:RNA polymerase sigma-K factor [Heliorestis convoluta]
MIDVVGALILPFIKGVTALMSYISNNAFPHPLNEKEERMYLQKLAEGDGEARNKLIEHNLRLVAHVCKKFDGTGENNDDLISIGTIGLIKAINTFKADKGTKLATYAARCIENEIFITIVCVKTWKKRTISSMII